MIPSAGNSDKYSLPSGSLRSCGTWCVCLLIHLCRRRKFPSGNICKELGLISENLVYIINENENFLYHYIKSFLLSLISLSYIENKKLHIFEKYNIGYGIIAIHKYIYNLFYTSLYPMVLQELYKGEEKALKGLQLSLSLNCFKTNSLTTVWQRFLNSKTSERRDVISIRISKVSQKFPVPVFTVTTVSKPSVHFAMALPGNSCLPRY